MVGSGNQWHSDTRLGYVFKCGEGISRRRLCASQVGRTTRQGERDNDQNGSYLLSHLHINSSGFQKMGVQEN